MREELIRVVRNGKMCEMFWRREEGIGAREQVVAWLVVYFFGKGSCKVISSEEVRGV